MMLSTVIPNHETNVRFRLALDRLREYTAMAPVQNAQIWNAQQRAQKAPLEADRMGEALRWFRQCRIEAHFYLICWDAVAKSLDTLRNNRAGLKSPRTVWKKSPRTVWKRHRETLDHYKLARDHMEHWTERLPGEAADQWSKWTSDGSQFIAGNVGIVRLEQTFQFHDQTWDISPANAALLTQIGRELDDELTFEVRPYQNRAIATAPGHRGADRAGEGHASRDCTRSRPGAERRRGGLLRRPRRNDSAVKVLGEPTLKDIARELVIAVKNSVTIDWTVRENVRAKIRVIVKRILRNYGYPPDKQQKATQTVLEQAEVLSEMWAVA
jgi:hypothetical protein